MSVSRICLRRNQELSRLRRWVEVIDCLRWFGRMRGTDGIASAVLHLSGIGLPGRARPRPATFRTLRPRKSAQSIIDTGERILPPFCATPLSGRGSANCRNGTEPTSSASRLVQDKVFHFLARQVQRSVRGRGGTAKSRISRSRTDQGVDHFNRLIGQHVRVQLGGGGQ
jgi:hypothetical protein